MSKLSRAGARLSHWVIEVTEAGESLAKVAQHNEACHYAGVAPSHLNLHVELRLAVGYAKCRRKRDFASIRYLALLSEGDEHQ